MYMHVVQEGHEQFLDDILSHVGPSLADISSLLWSSLAEFSLSESKVMKYLPEVELLMQD